MDIEGVIGVIYLLLYWRVVLCVLVASIGAFFLVHFLPWFSGLQGIVFAALGSLPGVIWEESTRTASAFTPSTPPTSDLVAGLAAAIFSAAWGAASSTSFHAAVAGAVVLVAAIWGWFRFAVVERGWLSRAQGALCAVVAAGAFPVAAFVAHDAF